jgi:hypothetical protein
MWRVFVETARILGKLLSFLARIGKSRRILLHGGFVLVAMPVLVCGFVARIVYNISRSKLRGGVFSGLAWLKRRG